MGRLKNTLVYSRKAYHEDKEFMKNVELTSNEATSLEDHIDRLQKLYPTYTVENIFTYEHSGLFLERTQSCKWDSSADGMVAYKKEEQLIKKLDDINTQLSY